MSYLLVAAVMIGWGLVPLPLPPGWIVLAYMRAELDLSTPWVIVVGALGVGVGRALLAMIGRLVGERALVGASRDNVDYLASRIHSPSTEVWAALIAGFGPAALSAAAGLLRLSPLVVGGGAALGRLVAYSIWLPTAGRAAVELQRRLRHAVGPVTAVIAILLLIAFFYLLLHVDWRLLLEERRFRIRR
jgi:membrane protein YqaA with SNARE-associated domain